MFFLYIVWYIIIELIFFFKRFIVKIYVFYNKINIFTENDFNDLSYLEKLFLILFDKNNEFGSVVNLNDKNEIKFIRKNNYPLINYFYFLQNREDFNFLSLNQISKQFFFIFKKNYFKKYKNNILYNGVNKNYFLLFLIVYKLYFTNFYNILGKTRSNAHLDVFKFYLLNYLNYYCFDCKIKIVNFNLNIYNDWFSYFFNKKINITIKKISNYDQIIEKIIHNIITVKILIIYKKYKLILKKYKLTFPLYFNFNNLSNFKISVDKAWNIKNTYLIKFKETSISKYVNLEASNLYNYSIMFLRKNRVFNKSRYSRNRQLYRTGVYWCIWLNIVLVYGLYFIFYRFSFNFGYIWWGLFFLLYSSIFSRIIKYNFFKMNFIISELKHFNVWLSFIFLAIFNYFLSLILILFSNLNFNFFIKRLKHIVLNKKFIYYFGNFYNKRDSTKIIEFWHGLSYNDISFLKYESIIHWFKLFLDHFLFLK